jgi:class 3 adenylate cyclase
MIKLGYAALGLRGDGVFAFFGDPRRVENRQLAAIAVGTTGLAMEAIRSDLNPILDQRGMERVQVRAGMDFGEVTFAQVGTPHGCEVNPTGFTSNFAAKCEKKAKSWEVVAGQGLADILPSHLLDRRGERAEEYTRGDSTKLYQHHYVEWEGFVEHMESIDRQLNGSPASAIEVG